MGVASFLLALRAFYSSESLAPLQVGSDFMGTKWGHLETHQGLARREAID